MPELSETHCDLRLLDSFILATLIQMETLRFCRRALPATLPETEARNDPFARLHDPMTRAARNGRQNLVESAEKPPGNTRLTRTAAACANFRELRSDYELFLLDRNQLPWSIHSQESIAMHAVPIDPPSFTEDLRHTCARHTLHHRRKFAPWLDTDDPTGIANALLVLLARTLKTLKTHSPANPFTEKNGSSEHSRWADARDDQKPITSTPDCPQCRKPMRRRTSARGDFWGCAGYPECKGVRPL
jgi:restriction system protein